MANPIVKLIGLALLTAIAVVSLNFGVSSAIATPKPLRTLIAQTASPSNNNIGNIFLKIFFGFDDYSPFMEGLAGVENGGKWGYIDKQGNFKIRAQFDAVSPFFEGIAGVSIADKWGFIDKKGSFKIKTQFFKMCIF